MKYKNILTIILLMLFLSSSIVVSATKIQKDDTWTYKDKDNKEYNEIALDDPQLKGYNANPLACIDVDTNRDYSFKIQNYTRVQFINYTYIMNGLYLTQEGGIPLIPKNYIPYGQIKIFDEELNNSIIYDVSNSTNEWYFMGNPALGLVSTISISFTIDLIIKWENNTNLSIQNTYEMKSNSNIEDKIKNYTITPTSYIIIFNSEDYYIYYNSDDGVQLNSFETAMKLTYEEGVNQPIYIAQTESITIDGLSLSQSTNLVEYFLVQEENETSDEDKTSYPFLFFITSIIILNKFKKKLNK